MGQGRGQILPSEGLQAGQADGQGLLGRNRRGSIATAAVVVDVGLVVLGAQVQSVSTPSSELLFNLLSLVADLDQFKKPYT